MRDNAPTALRGPWQAVLIGNDFRPITLDETGPYLQIEIRVARGSAVPVDGVLPGAHDDRDVLYQRDWFDDAADLAMRWEQAQAVAEMLNLAADTPPWHMVDFRLSGWTIQHPLSCRMNTESLFTCRFNTVLRSLSGPPAVLGVFRCEIGDDGGLQVYADDPAAGGAA